MDIDYLLLLQKLRNATGGIFDELMLYITTYGESLLTVMISAFVYWCVDKKQGVFTFLSYGLGNLANGFAKITACVYRPWIRDARVKPVAEAMKSATGYSFPSGHTTQAMATYGSLAANKHYSKPLRILFVIMVLLVGFSRNYLGVHTPQDVIVAILGMLVVIAFAKWLLKMTEQKKNFDIIVLAGTVLAAVALIIYGVYKSYPMDYDVNGRILVNPATISLDSFKNAGVTIGIVLGLFLERRFVNFSTMGNGSQKAARFIAGILGYLILNLSVKKLFPGNAIGKTFGSFIPCFYVTFIVPLFIKMCERKVTCEKDET